MADSTVKVVFLGDAKDLRRALDDVDTAAGKTSSSFGRIKDTAIGVFTGGALLGGVEKLASGLSSASKAAREDEAAQAQLKQALQNTVGATDQQVASVEKWISKTQNATGVLDDDLRPALATLLRATNDVGEAQSLMSLAMDISQATGKDLQSVSLALAKAHEGNVGGLQKLGISMKGANGETMAFADAQKELAELFGGAVATNLTTVQGRTQLLQARMADLQEEVGTRVNVAVLAFADFMEQRVVPAIQVVVAWVQEHWPEIRDTVEEVMTRIREVIETVLGVIQRFWGTWGDEIMLVIRTVFDFIRTWIESTMKIIQGIINVIMGLIHGDFSQVWEGIKQIFAGGLQYIHGLVDAAMGLLQATISAGMTIIAGIFDQMWEAIKNLTMSAINAYIDLMKKLYIDLPLKVAGLAVDAGVAIVGFFWDGLKHIADALADISARIVNFLIGLPGTVLQVAIDAGFYITAAIGTGMKYIEDRLATLAADLISFLYGLPGRVWTYAHDIGMSIANTIIDAVGDLGSKIWEAIKDGMGSLASKIKDKLTFDIPGIDIPGFASGGVVTKGPFQIVGEGGPEIVKLPVGSRVFNNTQSRQMLSAAAGAGSGLGGGGQVINIYIGKVNAESPGAVNNMAASMSRELAVALRGAVA